MIETASAARPSTRARYPDESGFVERDGVRVFWERYGTTGPAVVLLPTWSIVHSRFWKGQIPYLARHCRVVTFDGRGNGRSDRPNGASAYAIDEFVADTLAVMDATDLPSASLVASSCGALWSTVLAADHPGRVERIVYLGPAVSLAPDHPDRTQYRFDEHYPEDEGGWALYNRHAWIRDYPRFVEFFMAQCFNEPHSTKPIEDGISWALETTPEVLVDTVRGLGWPRDEPFAAVCGRVRCPTVVLHGDRDLIRPHAQGAALAEATAGRLVTFEGSGHLPGVRDPVRVNLLLRELIAPPPPPTRWARPCARPLRALYISSPIGLGHARRDVAIAGELRRRVPGLEIEWLAQHPVTAFLDARGERIHPASTELAGESAHIEAEAGEHELNAFQAIRRMDEILAANFMVFHDVVREEAYDLWIGDEAWELDHFLHENPELKTAPFAWLTDFVGWLPGDGGDAEAALTADLNAEMLEHVARHPRVRDRAVFVGDPDDIVPDRFGPGLPPIRAWTERHFRFSGHVTGFDTAGPPADRTRVRSELGYAPEDRVCIVTAGGSSVGIPLMRLAIESFRPAAALVPGLRMIVVCGPRIDPASLPEADGVELRAYEPDLHRHLAACDLAIVHGGLTTTMELTAAGRPFLYFPLARHFEQRQHVRYRLERHRAGRCMEFSGCDPARLAQAIAQEIGREVDYRPLPADGAVRAAAVIAELLPR